MTRAGSRLLPFLALCAVLSVPGKAQELVPDASFECDACVEWNRPQAPFRLFGNTWYVGTAGLAALLVDAGKEDGRPVLVLIDGGLPQSAPLIDANIRVLGFDPTDIRVILNSHAHFDHAGGIAALQRATSARVVVSEASLEPLRTGRVVPPDPQAGFAPDNDFPPVAKLETLPDGATLTVGDTTFTLHATPGHTPGSTSWRWETCEDERCATVLYADSLTPVSAPGFRFSEPLPAWEGRSTAEVLRSSIHFLRDFPCDVLVAPHPAAFRFEEKRAAREKGAEGNPFHAPRDCAWLAERMDEWLDRRLAEEAEDASRAPDPGPGQKR